MSHRGPFHAYFQSKHADMFSNFIESQQPDLTIPYTKIRHTDHERQG